MMLRAVAAHQLGVALARLVGEQQGLAQKRALKLLPGALLEAEIHLRQAAHLTHLDGE